MRLCLVPSSRRTSSPLLLRRWTRLVVEWLLLLASHVSVRVAAEVGDDDEAIESSEPILDFLMQGGEGEGELSSMSAMVYISGVSGIRAKSMVLVLSGTAMLVLVEMLEVQCGEG